MCALKKLVIGMTRSLGLKFLAVDTHHYNDVLDTVSESFVAAFVPVGC
jgi:hypothetical protein